MISAKVICDSLWKQRLTTMELEYPRFIHSQFMTHRMFSRNASSSRAIPTAKLIERVRRSPVMPSDWLENKPGMQGGQPLDFGTQGVLEALWRKGAGDAADTAEQMLQMGVHKQTVNRILEPYLTIKVLVTATEWDNFFNLRMHDDAQPEIQKLAMAMYEAIGTSHPETTDIHMPYSEDLDPCGDLKTNGLISAARCARVSYDQFGGGRDIQKDLALGEKLWEAGHLSPFEHQAQGLNADHIWSANFRGWQSFRSILTGGRCHFIKPTLAEMNAEEGWEG